MGPEQAVDDVIQRICAGSVSTHALREEGDALMDSYGLELNQFQSTPSARRATAPSLFTGDGNNISIHALREEGDSTSRTSCPVDSLFQSTPSARRATVFPCLTKKRTIYFNPRPPRGGRLLELGVHNTNYRISIHALREEGDAGLFPKPSRMKYFNPRPPRGGRPGAGNHHPGGT